VNARRIALKIFERGVKDAFLSKEVWKMSDGLNEKDRDLVRKLVYGTIRFLPSIDESLEKLLKKPSKTPRMVKDILRLGMYEIEFLRIPTYATVNEYTKLAPVHFKGVVNAILRNAAKEEKKKQNNSLPTWLYEMLKEELGGDFEKFLASTLFHDLSLRSVKMEKEILKEKLAPLVNCQEMRYSPWGLRCTKGMDLSGELFEKGYFTFQDESSQMVALAVSPRSRERILDACGGVGTKTSHLIQISPNSHVIYNDVNAKKREIALSNFKRMNLVPTQLWSRDILKEEFSDVKNSFDKILLDAPCSALGTIGKHPDVLLRLKEEHIGRNSNIQFQMIEKMWNLLKKGGTLVYSVCTVTRAETDDVIEKFIKSHDDAKTTDPFDGKYDFNFNGLGVQLLEHMEGFYISKIVKV
jgi:16S rRNA (cytosine967-C5)-methyltransferase